uniref:Biotin carboxyl carrier protein of acetyl-CoA carboxylase n=1 Tax=Erythrocystis saccata TaxID=2822695 RepID=A0A8E6NXF6_9FLOR|nr:acetyl-CoA carboxylase biotin carboxyl carrier protein [Erythrocystis saccata]
MHTTKNIKKFINSLKKNNINKIRINKGNTEIIINKVIKDSKSHIKEIKLKQIHKVNKLNDNNLKLKEKNIGKEAIDKDNKITKTAGLYSTIISPMVGTFYKSPAPNEDAFIEIGDIIKSKQVVCIIEAMKLMNEIESEIKGEVVEILVKDGEIVDCGQALMKIKLK